MTVGETPVTMVGTVISDVTLKRVGENANPLATFQLRATERKYDREKGAWLDHRQFSIRVKCWRKLASAAHAALRRGDPVIVMGKLFVSEFSGANGQVRSVPEVEAWAVGPNLVLSRAAADREQRGGGAAPQAWHSPESAHESQESQEVGAPLAVA